MVLVTADIPMMSTGVYVNVINLVKDSGIKKEDYESVLSLYYWSGYSDCR